MSMTIDEIKALRPAEAKAIVLRIAEEVRASPSYRAHMQRNQSEADELKYLTARELRRFLTDDRHAKCAMFAVFIDRMCAAE